MGAAAVAGHPAAPVGAAEADRRCRPTRRRPARDRSRDNSARAADDVDARAIGAILADCKDFRDPDAANAAWDLYRAAAQRGVTARFRIRQYNFALGAVAAGRDGATRVRGSGMPSPAPPFHRTPSPWRSSRAGSVAPPATSSPPSRSYARASRGAPVRRVRAPRPPQRPPQIRRGEREQRGDA